MNQDLITLTHEVYAALRNAQAAWAAKYWAYPSPESQCQFQADWLFDAIGKWAALCPEGRLLGMPEYEG